MCTSLTRARVCFPLTLFSSSVLPQEVTPESFKDDFEPFFKLLGYKQAIFQPKRHPQGSEQARKDMKRLLSTKKGRSGRFQHTVLGTGKHLFFCNIVDNKSHDKSFINHNNFIAATQL